MSMIDNLAHTMRKYMEQRNQNTAGFSEELEIARSTLRQYIEGKGNPSLGTVEHIARKLEIDPISLVCNDPDDRRTSAARYVLNTSLLTASLSEDDRQNLYDAFDTVISILEKTI